MDQYDDAKVALEHARLVRPWEGRKKRDKSEPSSLMAYRPTDLTSSSICRGGDD